MKINIIICVFTVAILFSFISCLNKINLKAERNEAEAPKKKNYSYLFTTPQVTKCTANDPIKLLLLDPERMGISKNKGKFPWVKAWGFDSAAYLFDFLDPVLRAETVAEFKLTFNAVKKLPNKNPNPKPKVTVIINGQKMSSNSTDDGFDPWYDPFDVKKISSKMASAIDYKIHNLSLNTIQINAAMKKFNWFINELDANPGMKMVVNHDFNNDGRLSAREFIIAVIRNNEELLGNPICQLCLNKIVQKIDAIFEYIDCDNNGLVSSEDIFEGFQKLSRPTKLWNYFLLAHQATIRTAVTNDFILKNMKTISGNLTKKEFRRGILLGFWDRQTDDYHIFNEDSKNLKSLRWRGNMIDVTAERYIKAVEEAKLKQAKELAAKLANQAVNSN